MSAHDALSDVQFVGHKELSGMYSGDHDEPMHSVKTTMRETYSNFLEARKEDPTSHPTDYDVHERVHAHGGPDQYVSHLAKDIAEHGIREPLEVRGGNVIINGNHRALAAIKLGLDRVPVKHIR